MLVEPNMEPLARLVLARQATPTPALPPSTTRPTTLSTVTRPTPIVPSSAFPVPSRTAGPFFPPTSSPTVATAGDPNDDRQQTSTAMLVAIIAVVVVAVFVSLYLAARYVRSRHKNPKYIPTKFLKNKWENWTPAGAYYYHPERTPGAGTEMSRVSDRQRRLAARNGRSGQLNSSGVNRNTSVRSVMTLPGYREVADPERETVIGREGERAGVDLVVEFPETEEEERERREEVLDGMYQIRVQRRQERAERQAAREARAQAVTAPNLNASTSSLDVTTSSSRQDPEMEVATHSTTNGSLAPGAGTDSRTRRTSTSEQLRALLAAERDRRLSEVSYADIGVVRADGSRARASSTTSDRAPLLDSAASIDGSSSNRARSPSLLSLDTSSHHRRSSSETTLGRVSSDGTDSRLETIPGSAHPPEYDTIDLGDAPAYSSPTVARLPIHLPEVRIVTSSPILPRGEARELPLPER